VSRRTLSLVAGALVVGLVVGASAVDGPLGSPGAAGSTPTPATATATVTRQTLDATTAVQGTLGFADSYAVANALGTEPDPVGAHEAYLAARGQYHLAVAAKHALHSPTTAQRQQATDAVASARALLRAATARVRLPRGVVTRLAAVGSIVQPGGVLYTLDATHPAVLMSGAVPAWRDLAAGVAAGVDVEQLETDLAALGFGSSGLIVDRHWDARTTDAVKRWQRSLGVARTGTVTLGSVVFEPGALRVTADLTSPGATVGPGTPVLQASSTRQVVTASVDPALQTQLKAGDTVSITLPDGRPTGGVVADVGSVAVAASNDGNGGDGGSSTPTIDVTVNLDDPGAGGTLDQAPVSVAITTATARDVLSVPVTALVALLEGGYAVQVKDASGLHYVEVTPGLFAGGWVEVAGPGLSEGQKVVVAQ
jgi:peptidoglycan hydrolase-like protein with peptidoglycan-binding domain